MLLPDPTLPWPIPMAAVALIAESEACRLRAYRCPAGAWTIGWGETDGVQPGDTCTREQADRWLCEDLTDRTAAVRKLCTEWPTEHQLGALVSLAYNIGLAGLARSSVLRAHNAGQFDAAARAYALWNKARVGGVLTVLAGLTIRRAREAALYLTPDPLDAPAPSMPQAVEPESHLAASPIAQAGAATTTAGGVLGVSVLGEHLPEVTRVVDGAKHIAEQMGLQPMTLLAGALIVGGIVVMVQRHKQRSAGWA